MRKALAISALLCCGFAMAQQDVNKNRITLYGGLTRYIGEIEQPWDQVDLDGNAFGALSYQRFLGYGTSAYVKASAMRLQANDLDNGNFQRGLNFRTELNSVELGFKTYLDNGTWLRYDARFAPFISIGAGVGTYNVLVDQFNADGGLYYYWTDGSVRNISETAPNAAAAVITGQDGNFETDVTELATEDGKPSSRVYYFIPAQLGVKVRLSSRFSLDLGYGFNWTFSDRLDDISGNYAAANVPAELGYLSNPTGAAGPRGNADENDHYHYLSIGIGYSFGRRSHSYQMTPFYVDEVTHKPAPPPPPAPPKPIAPVAPAPPAKKASTPFIVADELRVKRLVIEQLVVDSIIVLNGPVTKGPVARAGTLVVDSTKVSPSGSGKAMARDSMVVSALDTVPKTKVVVIDSAKAKLKTDTTNKMVLDSTRVLPKLRTDSTAKVIITPTAPRTTADSVRTAPKVARVDSTVKVTTPIERTDSVRVAPKVVPVDSVLKVSTPKAKIDSTKAIPAPIKADSVAVPVIKGAIVPVGVPVKSIQDTTSVAPAPKARPVGPESPTDTIMVGGSGEKREEPVRPNGTVGTTNTVTEPRTTVRTEIVTVKVPTVDRKRIAALEDSLASLRERQELMDAKLKATASDTTVKAAPKVVPNARPVPVDTSLANAGLNRSLKAREHEAKLNEMLMTRIAMLETYISMQEANAPDTTQEAMRQRMLKLDKQVDSMRDSVRTERKAVPATTIKETVPKETVARDTVAKSIKRASTDTLFFSTGSQLLDAEDKARLDSIASNFALHGSGKIIVTGHTDRSGQASFNLTLSQQRAEVVADHLRKAGVPVDAIKVKGLGEKLARSTYNVRERNVVVQMILDH